jgi:hypothetical protein
MCGFDDHEGPTAGRVIGFEHLAAWDRTILSPSEVSDGSEFERSSLEACWKKVK